MSYQIAWIGQNILSVKMEGFWTTAVGAQFEVAVRDAVARRPVAQFSGLCDIMRLDVQRPEILERLRVVLDHLRANGMLRGAIVTTSTLLTMQAKRTVDASRSRYFSDHDTALEWLRSELRP